MSDLPEFLTMEEAAARFKVHKETLCRLARRGLLPAGKIGSAWRMRVTDADKWFSENMATSKLKKFKRVA